ncbi:putative GTP-binding protein EngB [Ignatzschineria indica]|uniref:Probable GTP-binding protein EngB n=1 Tax=Ignatzschineria indica TaxID=472583 RepID=A0A2U2ANQ7_9GAMM|nr:ribosome biogenesis GTP-binding protein YihA/YsxC [Ignatzschineria indica]PWD84835.1 YihA family ribosome biogenesis GTP-binding protein [Ignatzschineria indica]GGZ79484.1 putative GTP-binding protein EngB [Ignatzschineria indica]
MTQNIRSLLRKTTFKTSANGLNQLPDSRAEIAFAGRSNAGKSSALNLITGQKTLARTSKTPGRTQLINYFEVLDDLYLVDLPGYGYAKVPLPMREHWQKILQGYFEERKQLDALIMLMDSRHPLTELDKQMLHWCEYQELPTHILLTKADKLSKNEASKALHHVRKVVENEFTMPITVQLFSSTKPEIGLNEALQYLGAWINHHEAE